MYRYPIWGGGGGERAIYLRISSRLALFPMRDRCSSSRILSELSPAQASPILSPETENVGHGDLQNTRLPGYVQQKSSYAKKEDNPVAEFIDPVRELKPAFNWG
jgi:hypothetical protein